VNITGADVPSSCELTTRWQIEEPKVKSLVHDVKSSEIIFDHFMGNRTGLSKKTLDDIEAKLFVHHIQGNV
jgi:hypothetical protein